MNHVAALTFFGVLSAWIPPSAQGDDPPHTCDLKPMPLPEIPGGFSAAYPSGNDRRGRGYVQAKFDREKRALTHLYRQEQYDSLCGILFLAIAIRPDGTVADVQVIESTMHRPTFESRIVKHVASMTFGALSVEGFDVFVYPMVFRSSEPQPGIPADGSRATREPRR